MSAGILIGIASVARAGKGTFANALSSIALSEGLCFVEAAFAFALKDEIDPHLRATFGISAWTQDTAEKTIIRPHLVELGRQRREESNGAHWINAVEPAVKEALARGCVVAISDVRYVNELNWVHSLGGSVVHLQRVLPSGEILGAANVEESINDGPTKAASDYSFSWPTFLPDQISAAHPYVLNVWTQIKARTLASSVNSVSTSA